MAITTSSFGLDTTSADAIRSMFDRRLLMRGVFEHVHSIPVKKDSLGMFMGDTKIYRRIEALAHPTGPLNEAFNPAPRSKTKSDVKVVMAPYGDVIEDTKFYVNMQPERVMAENVDLLGQQMGEYLDTLDRDNMAGATTQVFRNGSAITSVVDVVNSDTLERIIRTLRENKAKETVPTIMPSQNVNTFPMGPGYWAICDEAVIFDCYNVSGFKRPDEYGIPTGILAGEAGRYKTGLRFLRTPQGQVALGGGGSSTTVRNTAGTADVYSIFCVGQEALVSLRLDQGNGGVITHGFGTSGVSDSLNIRMTTGWYKIYGTGILNQLFFCEGLVAASL